MLDIIGKQIGQYQIEEQIGQGGMATVYRAYQPSINRYVAIKILPSQYAQDPNFVKRFEQEAKAIAALEHPHILPVYDFGTQEGLTYMVMRYVRGGTLSNLMGQPLSNERIVRLIGDMARALDYAHKQGVVHRDIKPSNILIDRNGEALLTDFGIAKLMEGSGATQLTGAGSVLGTPAYMSPEQAKGASVDGRSDVYSLGVVLYELLTGQQPYRAETPVAVVLKHVSEPLTPPRTVNANVPEPLERVVIKAMAKEPDQRYQTAGEMEVALQQALKQIESGTKTVNVPVSTGQTQQVPGVAPQPAKSGGKIGPWLIGGGVAVALLCLLGGGLLFFGLMSSANNDSQATPLTERSTPVRIGIEKTSTPTPTSIPDEPTPTPTTSSLAVTDPTMEPIPLAPGLDGEILFEDDFSANRNDWFTGDHSDEYGLTNSEFANGRYRISQEAKQGVFIWNSLPETDFEHFVMSVEARPVEQQVATPFAYGLTFREEVDNGDLYLFEIDTDGSYSVSLSQDGKWETLIGTTGLQAIKPEGPNQLTVKAVGPALTFYINGEEAATIEDDTLSRGAIGLALELYNEGDKASVDFDNLTIRQVSAEELAALDNDSGSILFEDTFDSDAKGWATGEFDDDISQDEITIEDGRYRLSVTAKPEKQPYIEKFLPNREFSDFILTLEATPRDSEEYYSYGIAFRADKDDNDYVFQIGNDGLYAVRMYKDGWSTLKDWSSSSAIKLGETNRLIVTAKDNSLTFVVNDVQLTTLEDSTLSKGRIGLVLEIFEAGKAATVEFDNLTIRKP
jgi:serine/threonine protein kinase